EFARERMAGPEAEQRLQRLVGDPEHLGQLVAAGVGEGHVDPEEAPAPAPLRDPLSPAAVETFDDLGHRSARLRPPQDGWPGPASPSTSVAWSTSARAVHRSSAPVSSPQARWRLSAGGPGSPAVQRSPQAAIPISTSTNSNPFGVRTYSCRSGRSE